MDLFTPEEQAERAALLEEIRKNLERMTDNQRRRFLEELIRDGIIKDIKRK